MRLIKLLAILTNTILPAVIILVVLSHSHTRSDDILGCLVIAAVAVVDLLAITHPRKDNWLSLYFQRKRLEEEAKIKGLTQAHD